MYTIGRICIKLAGRDAGREAVIVDVLDDKFVLVDGNVRRRKCNVLHLEPTTKTVELAKNASHDEVAKAFEAAGLLVWNTKPRQAGTKPVKQKKVKTAEEAPKETKKKSVAKKKEEKKTETPVTEEKKEAKPKAPKKSKAETTEGKAATEKKPRAPRKKKEDTEKKE